MIERAVRGGFSARARRSAHRFNCLGQLVLASAVAALTQIPGAHAAAAPATPDAEVFAAVDRIFADYALDAHIPGLVYGIVAQGRLVYVRGIGVQELESNRPVTADTLFRIASMTKAFTALTVLKLRDDGKLRLDALAETYVPELRGWQYPTQDSPQDSRARSAEPHRRVRHR